MSNIEGQTHRVVGPASLADILGTGSRPPIATPLASSHGESSGYDRASVLAESAGRNIDPRFVGLGSRVTVDRKFI